MAKKSKSKKAKVSKTKPRVSKRKSNKTVLGRLLSFIGWLTGVIVSLAVGFSMTMGGALNQSIPWLSELAAGNVVSFFGYVVIVATILGALLAIIHYFSK
jgi:cytochrome c biogenesis protein CcdA